MQNIQSDGYAGNNSLFIITHIMSLFQEKFSVKGAQRHIFLLYFVKTAIRH
jgi:hypothetical protein